MPYLVNKFDGSQLVVLEDGSIDITATSLGLVGRNYTGYGEILNENFVFLLENFSNNSPPSTPLKGQCWYNNQNGILNVYNGENWNPIGSATVSQSQPEVPSLGQLWIKTPENVLYFYDGFRWLFIGPEVSPGFGITRARSSTLASSSGTTYPVILITVNDTVLSIVSSAGFTISPSNPIPGFDDIIPGINLRSGTSLKSDVIGTTSRAERLSVPRLINGVSFDGSQNITVRSQTTNALSAGSFINGETFDGSVARSWSIDASSVNQIGKIVARDSQGNFSAGTIFADFVGNLTGNVEAETGISKFNILEAKEFRGLNLSGNAFTATKLETARRINQVLFNGTEDITVTANAETLTGQFLNNSIKQASLTKLGILDDLKIKSAGLTIGNNDELKISVDQNGEIFVNAGAGNRNFQLIVANKTWQWLSPSNAQSAGGDNVSTLSYIGNEKYNIGLPDKKFGKIYADDFIGNLSGNANTSNSSTTSGRANNLSGGGTGSIPYQSSQNNTVFLGPGSAGQFLVSTGSGPQWTNAPDSGVISIVAGNNVAVNPTFGTGNVTVNVNPSGSDQQIQYNKNNLFAGDALFKFDDSAKLLTIGSLSITNRSDIGQGPTGNNTGIPFITAGEKLGFGVGTTSNSGLIFEISPTPALRKTGAADIDLGTNTNQFRRLYLSDQFHWGGKNIPAPTTGTTTFLRNDGTWASIPAQASVLPSQAGNSGKFLQTFNGSPRWETVSVSGAGAAGQNNQIQFNNGGLLDADGIFTFDKSNKLLRIGGFYITNRNPTTPYAATGNETGIPVINAANAIVIGVGDPNQAIPVGVMMDINSPDTAAFRKFGTGEVDIGKSGSSNQFNDIWFKGSLRWNGKNIPAPTDITTEFLRRDGSWAVPAGGGGPSPTVSINFDTNFLVNNSPGGTISGTGSVALSNNVALLNTVQTFSVGKIFTGGIRSQAYNFTPTDNSIFYVGPTVPNTGSSTHTVQIAVDGIFSHLFYKSRFVVNGIADGLPGEAAPGGSIVGVDNGSTGGAGVAGVHTQAQAGLGVGVFATGTSPGFTGAVFQGTTTRAKSNSFMGLRLYTSGSLDPIFQVRGDGAVQADGPYTTPAADYAEYFEWADGNPDNEDRTGMTVSLTGDKIKIAGSDEKIIGVVSAVPGVVGDARELEWQGKFLRDELGRYITEPYFYYEWTDDQGNKQTEPSYGDLSKVPENAVRKDTDGFGNLLLKPMLNPDYDPDVIYVPRSKRAEWSAIGLLGKLRVKKGQIIPENWIKLKDINDDLEEWLVR
jgi:hypothetical protein